jgi:hypothetical protein
MQTLVTGSWHELSLERLPHVFLKFAFLFGRVTTRKTAVEFVLRLKKRILQRILDFKSGSIVRIVNVPIAVMNDGQTGSLWLDLPRLIGSQQTAPIERINLAGKHSAGKDSSKKNSVRHDSSIEKRNTGGRKLYVADRAQVVLFQSERYRVINQQHHNRFNSVHRHLDKKRMSAPKERKIEHVQQSRQQAQKARI